MKTHFTMFAAYNAWANERLYGAVSRVPDADYRADHGAFFRSLRGTLNHLLVGDRVWMTRFTGVGELPPSLDAILYDGFDALQTARRAEDERISRYVDSLDADDLGREIRYRTMSRPGEVVQPLAPALAHMFNHETHHRGQAHALLTRILGRDGAPGLDLIDFQRATGMGMS